jgi:transcriptional regulator with XRE-family HTH domain
MSDRNSRIKKVLEPRGLQQKVADKLGITRQAVNLRLSGDKEVDSVDFIKAVAEVTGRSFDWLITGKGEEQGFLAEPHVEGMIEKIEKLVRSQNTTIHLLEKRMKVLEDQLKSKVAN